MSRYEQFMNFPKPHIVNLLSDMTDLNDELENKLAESERKLSVAVNAMQTIKDGYVLPNGVLKKLTNTLKEINGDGSLKCVYCKGDHLNFDCPTMANE